MNKINFEFNGNLGGLIEFMEATFKNPNAMNLSVTVTKEYEGERSRAHATLQTWPRIWLNCIAISGVTLSSASRDSLLGAMPDIITFIKQRDSHINMKLEAIKKVRLVANTSLKDSKSIVEAIIYEYERHFPCSQYD